MNELKSIGTVLVLLGAALFVLSMLLGKVKFYVLVIFPVIVVDGAIGSVAMLCLIAGVILFIMGWFRGPLKGNGRTIKGSSTKGGPFKRSDAGGIVFIGPFPIVFGSERFRKGTPSWWVLFLAGTFFFILFMIIIFLMASLSRHIRWIGP